MSSTAIRHARMTRAVEALHNAAGCREDVHYFGVRPLNKRKYRQAKSRVYRALQDMSLTEYLMWLNKDGTSTLTNDIEHWHEIGIATAPELGRYLDDCVEREMRKDSWA